MHRTRSCPRKGRLLLYNRGKGRDLYPEAASRYNSPMDTPHIARPAAVRDWTASAIRHIEADFLRSADTHLVPLALPELSVAGVL